MKQIPKGLCTPDAARVFLVLLSFNSAGLCLDGGTHSNAQKSLGYEIFVQCFFEPKAYAIQT